MTTFAIMDVPALLPEILTTPAGPFFIVQFMKDTNLLSALHSYSDTLSVHSMDISLVPLFIYKIPKNCCDVLVTNHLMYTKQQLQTDHNDECDDGVTEINGKIQNSSQPGAVGVIGSNTTALRIGEDAAS